VHPLAERALQDERVIRQQPERGRDRTDRDARDAGGGQQQAERTIACGPIPLRVSVARRTLRFAAHSRSPTGGPLAP